MAKYYGVEIGGGAGDDNWLYRKVFTSVRDAEKWIEQVCSRNGEEYEIVVKEDGLKMYWINHYEGYSVIELEDGSSNV